MKTLLQQAYATGEINKKIGQARSVLQSCTLCPRGCKMNRLQGESGACGTDAAVTVASSLPHFGEEPPLSGTRGSGTVFFSHCGLHCCFCQNYQISQKGQGRPVTSAGLAEIALDLQQQGCHNLNLVSPTHYVPPILESLYRAAEQGFGLPVVYNTNGYENTDTLSLLEGIVDIYLPDIKYSDDQPARRYSDAAGYPEVNRRALLEMRRQVGNLQCDDQGLARRGLIIRHLVLPHDLAGSLASIRFLADNGFQNTRVSVMAQYRPAYRAARYPELSRPVTGAEYRQVLDWFAEYGFDRLWTQELEACDHWVPDFDADDPFAR